MQKRILTRMGDGERVSMPADEVKEELLLGTQDAAQNGEIPELTAEDLEQLFDIVAETGRVVSVPHGDEVVVTG
jgi:dimethylamine--corrinoid protein Co-methyltransferase